MGRRSPYKCNYTKNCPHPATNYVKVGSYAGFYNCCPLHTNSAKLDGYTHNLTVLVSPLKLIDRWRG